ncbi:MAG: hypothetical protein AAF639_24825 [Chloroflexota bacterium]
MNTQANRPNILLTTTDQQCFDAAGDATPSFLRTPYFDNLCREGIFLKCEPFAHTTRLERK